MRKNLLLFLYSLFGFLSAFSQTVVVSVERNNFVFVGVDIPITIACESCTSKDLTVITDNGIISGKGNKYIINASKKGNVNLSLFCKGTPAGIIKYKACQVPQPELGMIIGSELLVGGVIKNECLFSSEGLACRYQKLPFELDYQVVGFKTSFSKKGYVESARSQSNTFSKEQKELFEMLEYGSKLYFEDIKVKYPDGSIKTGMSFALKIQIGACGTNNDLENKSSKNKKGFTIQEYPKMQASISGISSGLLSKKTLDKKTKVMIHCPSCNNTFGFAVTEFVITVLEGDKSTDYLSSSASLTSEQLQAIKNAQNGTILKFHSIKAANKIKSDFDIQKFQVFVSE